MSVEQIKVLLIWAMEQQHPKHAKRSADNIRFSYPWHPFIRLPYLLLEDFYCTFAIPSTTTQSPSLTCSKLIPE